MSAQWADTDDHLIRQDWRADDPAIAYRLAEWQSAEYARDHPASPDPADVATVRARIAEAEGRTRRTLHAAVIVTGPQPEPCHLLRGLLFALALSGPLWAVLVGLGWIVVRKLGG